MKECIQYSDCELPDGTTDNPDEEVVCPQCGMIWEYDDGWFVPTDEWVNDDD